MMIELLTSLYVMSYYIYSKRKSSEQGLQQQCERTVAAFLHTEICSEVQQAIAASLLMVYGTQHDSKAFAIRSSAAGCIQA